MDDLTITYEEILKSCDQKIKTIPTNFNEKKAICKLQNFYIILAFLLISITLLISFSIYNYLIKYHANQNHLLPSYYINNELKQVLY